jgi:transposase-like protein
MMAAKRQTHTAEFKHAAVRPVTVHGYGVAEAVRNLGINATRLCRWKRKQEPERTGASQRKGVCRLLKKSATASGREVSVSRWSGRY